MLPKVTKSFQMHPKVALRTYKYVDPYPIPLPPFPAEALSSQMLKNMQKKTYTNRRNTRFACVSKAASAFLGGHVKISSRFCNLGSWASRL